MNNYLELNLVRFKKKLIIYDSFFTNGNLKIIIGKIKKHPDIIYNNQKPIVSVGGGRHNEMSILTFEMPIFEEKIVLKINGKFSEINVNKYADVKNEIIMTTVTKDQDNYIIPWIEYYKHLGVTRFMIYDNSGRKTLGKVLEKYINEDSVFLFNLEKKRFPYRINGKLLAQPLQQNHSLHAFKNAQYIGMFDIDEYLNPQKNFKCLPGMFSELLIKYKTNYKKLAGFSFENRYFYNPKLKADTNFKHFNIGYCSKNTTGRFRKKMFINPENVTYFTIHTLSSYKGRDVRISPQLCFFNHYRYIGLKSRVGGSRGYKDLSILRHLNWLDKNILTSSSKEEKKERKLQKQKKQDKQKKKELTKSQKKRRKILRRNKKKNQDL